MSDEEWELIVSMTHLDPNERVNLEHVVMKLKAFAEKEGNEQSNENIVNVHCEFVVQWKAQYCQVSVVQSKNL